MNYSDDLLEQAEHLLKRERLRPRQASLRRSVSSSYYALFHLLSFEAASTVGANLDTAALLKIQRWLDHGEMKRVCGMFSVPTPHKTIAPILGAPVSLELQIVAQSFIQLQEARHSADYDMSSTWTRLTAQQFLLTAKDAVRIWSNIRRTHEANVFTLALFSAKLFDRER
jgi:hypothetical protein